MGKSMQQITISLPRGNLLYARIKSFLKKLASLCMWERDRPMKQWRKTIAPWAVMRENAAHTWGLFETNEAATQYMLNLSWLPSATCALSQNLFVKAWEPSNMSTNLPKQRQSHIHKLPNSSTSHSQETSAYNLVELCYPITRCTWHFQASSP